MQNPYSIIKDSEHAPKDWYDPRYGAWEEGDANGDERGYARGKADRYEQIKRQRAELDSQKQIVSELVEACEDALMAIDPYLWASTRGRVKLAIAKATGI